MTKKSYRAVNNTIILNIQLFISLLLGFVVTRFVLEWLGEVNYGIYTLVGGVVATLAFLQSVLSNSTMRFLTTALGKNDIDFVNKTFHTTVYIHRLMGLGIVIISEIGGLIMFKYLLNIPPDRLVAAKWVFQFVVFSTFITIVSIPYQILITAHENFLVIAIIEISSKIIKLLLLFILFFNLPGDKLILYSILILIITFFNRQAKVVFSKVKYKKIIQKNKGGIDKSILKEIMSFSGWILFGVLCSIGYQRVTGIIINMFFGVRLNAANGIARQIRSRINLITVNLTRSILPQLMKSEGGGNRKRMLELTGISTKFATYVFGFFAIPTLFELPIILKLWLVNVPDYTVVFCRWFLIGLLISKLTFHLGDAIRAVGKIKWFQITESIMILLNLPISYFLFKKGYPPQTIYIVPLILGVFVIGLRLYFAHTIADLNIKEFLLKVIAKATYPVIGSISILFIVHYYFNPSIFRLVLSFVVSSIFFIIIMILWGLSEKEKQIISSYIKHIIRRD